MEGGTLARCPPPQCCPLRALLAPAAVVVVEDVPPGVDVDGAGRPGDQHHEGQLDHVADLHQHDGGHQGQQGDVAVIFGLLPAAPRPPRRHRCRAVAQPSGVLPAAELGERGTG